MYIVYVCVWVCFTLTYQERYIIGRFFVEKHI